MTNKRLEILLSGFSIDSRAELKKLLHETKFEDLTIHETDNIEYAINSTFWTKLDLNIIYVDAKDYGNSSFLKKVLSLNPTIFISPLPNLNLSLLSTDDQIYDFIPEKELTSFVVEKSLINILDKVAFKNRLAELEKISEEKFENEQKYRDLFENSAIGMYEVDRDGNFILANQVFFNILGLSDHSDLMKLNAFKKGISSNGTREKLQELLEKKDQIVDLEDEWIKADNTKIIVKENIRVKKDSKGNIQYYQGVVEDISKRKDIEAELVKSKKDAEKSDKLKSEFLTQISHEIRTPVNTLLSFVALIEDELHDSLSEELIGCFEHLNNAGQRITRTIDLLIKMSELQTDNYDPEFKRHDLFEVIEELVTIYKPLAEDRNLTLEFIKGIDSANIIFDKLTVYDIFSNLIDNAIKYTRDGTVKIYIKNTLLNKVSVTVIDTGVGISQEYIGNIFQPFSQETSGYTRKFDGNGLGLSLVKEYCDLNNAEIFVSSEKNMGSNFTVIFK